MVSMASGIKSAARKAYLAVPGGIYLAAYLAKQISRHQPLTRIGSTPENIYGPMLSSGLWIGYEVARQNAVSRGVDPARASAAYLAAGAGGLITAKLLYLAQFNESVLQAGGTWYGGAIGGVAALALYAKAARISAVKLLDSLAPAGLIGLGIGRLGCWSAGCCAGEVLGIPTEPIEAAFGLSLGFYLNKALKDQSFEGKTFLQGMVGYAVFRFMVEFFRHEPQVFANLTLSQIISAGLITAAGVLYRRWSNRIEAAPAQPAKETHRQKSRLRLAETLIIPALSYFTNLQTGIMIGVINLIRAIKEYLYGRKERGSVIV